MSVILEENEIRRRLVRVGDRFRWGYPTPTSEPIPTPVVPLPLTSTPRPPSEEEAVRRAVRMIEELPWWKRPTEIHGVGAPLEQRPGYILVQVYDRAGRGFPGIAVAAQERARFSTAAEGRTDSYGYAVLQVPSWLEEYDVEVRLPEGGVLTRAVKGTPTPSGVPITGDNPRGAVLEFRSSEFRPEPLVTVVEAATFGLGAVSFGLGLFFKSSFLESFGVMFAAMSAFSAVARRVPPDPLLDRHSHDDLP